MTSSIPLHDQAERDRFIYSLDQNFCVSAGAGVGKTTAIVSRITEIAKNDLHLPGDKKRLPRLVVVTYTKAAASELKARTKASILKNITSSKELPLTLRNLRNAFFGTIHSYCLELVQLYGKKFGISPQAILLESEDDKKKLWEKFTTSPAFETLPLQSDIFTSLFQFVEFDKILDAAQVMSQTHAEQVLQKTSSSGFSARPTLHLEPLLDYVPSNARSRKNVEKHQNAILNFKDQLEGQALFISIPNISSGGQEFAELVTQAFAPLQTWINSCSEYIVAIIANAFLQYRLDHEVITFDDMIYWSYTLLADEQIRKQIRSKAPIVILDEAQDTDSQMFQVLTEICRPLDAPLSTWPADPESAPPLPGHFCFVGDDQQAIYSSRATPGDYMRYLNAFRSGHGGSELTFSVTMRCPAIVSEKVNHIFGSTPISTGNKNFRPLLSRPDALPGHVTFWTSPAIDDLGTDQAREAESEFLAQQLKALGPEGVGAAHWGEIAVLAARRKSLEALATALTNANIPFFNSSSNLTLRARACWSWPTALLYCLFHPDDKFELIGVLREIFGISDRVLLQQEQNRGLSFDPLPQTFSTPELQEALQMLATLQEKLSFENDFSLAEFVEEVIQTTDLEKRLQSLGSENEDTSLWEFLATAREAETNHETLYAFISRMCTNMDANSQRPNRSAQGVQLLTMHKSKGLEWPVVILFTLSGKISPAPPSYPRIFSDKTGKKQLCVYKTEAISEADEHVKQLEQEENNRLFYVAATRAKKHLIFIDAHSLYPSRSTNSSLWERLNMQAHASSSEDTSVFSEAPVASLATPPSEHLLSPAPNPEAARISQKIPRRTLPHTLAKEDYLPLDQITIDPASETSLPPVLPGGVEYGIWWHSTLEKFPWKSPRSIQEHYLDQAILALEHHPHQERGTLELNAFRQSEALRQILTAGDIFLIEAPFLHPLAPQSWLDGVIDLIVISHAKNPQAWIIDWKTNRPTRNQPEASTLRELASHYAAQLDAYADAIQSHLQKLSNKKYSLKKSLYSTFYGKLIDTP